MPSAGTITVDFDAKIARLQQKLKTASGSVKKTAVNMRRSIAPAMAAIQTSAAAAALGIAAMATAGLRSADTLAKTADKLGLATESLAGLRLAAERFSGFTARQFDLALQRMTRRIAEAAVGTGEAQQALKDLGLDAQQLSRMTPDKAFRRIADAIQGVEGQGQRLRIAFKLFDSEGAGLVNTLNAGSGALDEMQARAEALGIAIDRNAAAKAEQANDAIAELRASAAGLAQTLAIELAPSISASATAMADWVAENDGFSAEISTGFRVLVRVVGALADGVHALRLVFKGLQVVVADFLDFVLQKFAWVNRAILNDINRLIAAYNLVAEKISIATIAPVQIDETGLERAADVLRNRRNELYAEWQQLVMQQLPSQALQQMVKTAEEAADKAAMAIKNRVAAASAEITRPDSELFPELTIETGLDRQLKEAGLRNIQFDVQKVERSFSALKETSEEVNKTWQDLGFTFQSAFEDALVEGMKLRDVMKGLLQDILRIAVRKTITEPLGAFFGNIFSGFRAEGGPVFPGRSYVVGERGPELFVPQSAGMIVPNRAGGVVINNTIDARGADEARIMRIMPAILKTAEDSAVNRIVQLRGEGRL